MPVAIVVRGEAGRLVDVTARRRVRARLLASLRALGRARSSATLVFTDDREIRELNRRYRGIDRATDVLSFHLQELAGERDPSGDGIALGDIVISIETAARRAPRGRTAAELERLAVHGLCHLFGHDHKRPPEARRMFSLERRLRGLPLDASGVAGRTAGASRRSSRDTSDRERHKRVGRRSRTGGTRGSPG